MTAKKSSQDSIKSDIIRSGKILLEVELKMVTDDPVDVIIGKRDFYYEDPETKKEVKKEFFDELNKRRKLNQKEINPEEHKILVDTKDIKKKIEELLGSKNRIKRANIKTTDCYVRACLTPDQIREIVGEIQGSEGIKGIQRVWLNKKTKAQLNTSNHTIKAAASRTVFDIKGKDICWAVIDTGIDKTNPLISSAVMKDPYNFTDEEDGDKNGHGTHVAGIIASRSEDFPGIAPEAKLYDFKVLDENGEGDEFAVIEAMEKIREINFTSREIVIHGVNISLGSTPVVGSYGVGQTPVCQEANRLMRSGVVVVVAAGNDGHKILAAFRDSTNVEYFRTFMDLTICDPGNAEEVITVGSVHKENPHKYGISYFSAKGPTGDGRYKPDLVAPGERIKSLGLKKDDNLDGVEMSGTSMAAPHVSGAIALLLSAKREFIGESHRIKQIVMDTCTDLKREPYFQGKGLLDILRAIQSV